MTCMAYAEEVLSQQLFEEQSLYEQMQQPALIATNDMFDVLEFPDGTIVINWFEHGENYEDAVEVARVANTCECDEDAQQFFDSVIDSWQKEGLSFDFADYIENGGMIAAWKINHI